MSSNNLYNEQYNGAHGEEKVVDLTDDFVVKFNKMKIKIESNLERSQELHENELPSHFNDIRQTTLDLQKYISESTKFLPSYNVRLALDNVKILVDRTESEQAKLLPKKKFAFKKKNHLQPTPTSRDIPDSASLLNTKSKAQSINLHTCGFAGLHGESVTKVSSEISGKDVDLNACVDCSIYLYGYPNTVRANGLKNCRIFTGPVVTSVFVEECYNCTFVVACQQLRVHSSSDCNFYLHVVSRGIIEDCKGLGFAPYNFTYPELTSDFRESGLGQVNNWNQIDDFNWLSKDVPSPNWSILETDQHNQIGDAI